MGISGGKEAIITNCYSTSSVKGDRQVGGLIGSFTVSKMTNCYSAGKVNGNEKVGGLVGYFDGYCHPDKVTNSFWNTETSGLTVFDEGENNFTTCRGLTTAEMKKRSSFTDWDFKNTWTIKEGQIYPTLNWQTKNPKPSDTSNSDSNEKSLSLESIIEGWKRNYGAINSMKVSYSETLVDFKGPKNELKQYAKTAYIDRFEQDDMFYQKSAPGSGEKDPFNEASFDGTNSMYFDGFTKSGGIKKGNIDGSYQFNCVRIYMLMDTLPKLYLDKKSMSLAGIPELLLLFRGNKVEVSDKLERIGNDNCHVLIINNQSGEVINKVWIAHEKSMLPVKYQGISDGRVEVEITLDNLKRAKTDSGIIWYPVEATRILSKSDGEVLTYQLRTTEFVPNAKYTKEDFKVKFPVGASVVDQVLGVEYQVGKKGEIKGSRKLKEENSKNEIDNIRGTQSFDITEVEVNGAASLTSHPVIT